jgi:hydrogenase nickel incorporation protein HypA/HybF
MHELALADAIVRICCDHARGRPVTGVEVKVGRLRQVVPDALTFAFELVAAGTPVEGAELELEEIPTRVECSACGATTEVDSFPLACARCGNLDTSVVAGEELHVESIEVEQPAVAVRGR